MDSGTLTALGALLALLGCGEPATLDAGRDASSRDTMDAGAAPRDAGAADAAVPEDAGPVGDAAATDAGDGALSDGGLTEDAALTTDASSLMDGALDGGVSTPNVARVQAAQDRLFLAACTCDMEEFTTVEECVAFDENPAYEACERTTETMIGGAATTAFDCIAGAYETAATCEEAAACDGGARAACRSAFNAALDLCDNPPLAYAIALDTCLETDLIGGPSSCPENPGGTSATGDAVFTGTTVLGGNDFGPCDAVDAPDRAFRWTAPASGDWVFDTLGSAFDTALGVYDGCAGSELACNDDALDGDIGRRSRLTSSMVSGQTVIVVVDGYELRAGAFQVNIHPSP